METTRIKVKKDQLIIIRMQILSNVLAPIVIQPKLDMWVTSDGSVITPDYKVSPAYVLLQTGSTADITFTFKPPVLTDQNILFGAINIPSAENYLFPIQLQIVSGTLKKNEVYNIAINSAIPPEIPLEEDATSYLNSKETLKFIAGLASLEVIPSKWLVAELILQICGNGAVFSETETGKVISEKLRKTRLFKNGSLIFRAAQIPEWVNLANSISEGLTSFSKQEKSQSGIINGWEIWLYNLMNQDIESPDFKHSEVILPPKANTKLLLDAMALDPEKWFLFLILGLYNISPRVHDLFDQVIKNIEVSVKEPIIEVNLHKEVINENGSMLR